jgi:multimeric flavodoxin WrbA/nitrite reductase/ring-hydroxylating ferredoxin subunit
MPDPRWTRIGTVEALRQRPLQQVEVGRTRIALSYVDGAFGAVSGACNHVGGPLGEGRLDGDYITCPWHGWKFHRATGVGEPGFEEDQVPRYELLEDGGELYVDLDSATKRKKKPHPKHHLDRPLGREPGDRVRVLGISTTNMDVKAPRYSTSDALLDTALAHASDAGCETKLIKLRELTFRTCEGYYSKSARACTWPCSITQMDESDEMDEVYEGIVFWADVILVATPIRWGVASSLYFKMAERLNCVQNQITLRNRVMLRNKVAGFVITGGQDNVQGVAGQALGFFSELGCQFPQFPYIAHSRGWSAEDMEENVRYVQASAELHDGARALVDRAVDLARRLIATAPEVHDHRAGRKASGFLSARPSLPVIQDDDGS